MCNGDKVDLETAELIANATSDPLARYKEEHMRIQYCHCFIVLLRLKGVVGIIRRYVGSHQIW